MIALVTLAPEPSFFWVALIHAVAALFASLAVSAISIVFHQFVTYGIGPIRWLRPFRFVRVRIMLRREYRQQVEKVRRQQLHAAAAGRARPK